MHSVSRSRIDLKSGWRFESPQLSHAFPEFGDFAMTGAGARIPRASAGAEIGDRLERVS